MTDTQLTPDEYELHLSDLRERLCAFLERGEGNLSRLRRDAENVLALTDEFPDVWARYGDVEGLVAEMLARQEQLKYMAPAPKSEAPGCLLGWLMRLRKGGG